MASERREEARLSLEDIYERTRVRVDYLRGIEEGDYRGFPDLVYVKGFVRTYLGVIGAEDLKDEFISWLGREKNTKELNIPPTNILGNGTTPTRGFKPASHLWLFTLLLLMLAGSGAYVWYSWNSSPFILRPLGAVPGAADTVDTVETVVSEDSAEPESAAGLVSLDAPAPLLVLPVASREPDPVPVPVPQPYLHIRAKGDVWMRVAVGEKVVFTKTLKSGMEVSWDLPAEARVTYGRPNMADVVLNGKSLGLANPRGSRNAETYFYNPNGIHGKIQQ
jgi:hypothetical protein